LKAHDLGDGLVFDRAQLLGIDLAFGLLGAGLQQVFGAQKAANVVVAGGDFQHQKLPGSKDASDLSDYFHAALPERRRLVFTLGCGKKRYPVCVALSSGQRQALRVDRMRGPQRNLICLT
jgi:hypothetical protein